MVEAVRIGLIGAGRNMRERHLPGFARIEGVEVRVVCNRSEESGRRVAEAFSIPRVVTDVRAVFEDPEVDAVCIGTWPYRHRDYTVAALDAGKHVLVEARMSANAAEARDMLAASQRHPQLVAQIVPSPRDLLSGATVRRLIEQDALGTIYEVHVDILNGQGIDPSAPLHWRERFDYSGVNTMTLGLFIEVLHRWLGPTRRVMADGATFIAQRRDPEGGELVRIEIPDSLGVLATMEGGARVTYRASAVTRNPRGQTSISIYGSKGTLHWQGDETMTLALDGQPAQPLPCDPGTERPWRVEQDFIDSIREGAPVRLTSFEDGLLYMRVTEAIHRSRVEGRAVDVSEV